MPKLKIVEPNEKDEKKNRSSSENDEKEPTMKDGDSRPRLQERSHSKSDSGVSDGWDSEDDEMSTDGGKIIEGSETAAAKNLAFPRTLMYILSNKEFSEIITWLPHGTSFRVIDKKAFMDIVSPRYFNESKYESFTRKLNRWCFKRISKGEEVGAFYHPFFQRDNMSMLAKIRCRKNKKAMERKRRKSMDSDASVPKTLPKKSDEEMESSSQNAAVPQQDAEERQEHASHAPEAESISTTSSSLPILPIDKIKAAQAAQLRRSNYLRALNMRQQQQQRLIMEASMQAHLSPEQQMHEHLFQGPSMDAQNVATSSASSSVPYRPRSLASATSPPLPTSARHRQAYRNAIRERAMRAYQSPLVRNSPDSSQNIDGSSATAESASSSFVPISSSISHTECIDLSSATTQKGRSSTSPPPQEEDSSSHSDSRLSGSIAQASDVSNHEEVDRERAESPDSRIVKRASAA